MTPRERTVEMEVLIGWALLAGVASSVSLIAAGLLWHWVAHGDVTLDYAIASTSVYDFLVTDVAQVLARARPRTLINLGLGVLMLTPYVRVLASLVYFAVVERDWKYTAFTGFVFATLTYALLS